MKYKVDVNYEVRFVVESEGDSLQEAIRNAVYDFSVPDGDTKNACEELFMLSQLAAEREIKVTGIYVS